MIHVRDLVKAYDDLQRGKVIALSGLSFDAMPGQIYGLLGPNGAGKTTALRILEHGAAADSRDGSRSMATTCSRSRRWSATRSASCRRTRRSTIA